MHAGEFWREFLLVEAVHVPSFESILSVFGPVRLLHVELCQTRNLYVVMIVYILGMKREQKASDSQVW